MSQSQWGRRRPSPRKILHCQYAIPKSGSIVGTLLILMTFKAKNHGNEPSKGAKIDAELKAEEEEMMKKKGSWGSKQ